MEMGSEGFAVRILQVLIQLFDWGRFCQEQVQPDGFYGFWTSEAVRYFQLLANRSPGGEPIAINGNWDPETRKRFAGMFGITFEELVILLRRQLDRPFLKIAKGSVGPDVDLLRVIFVGWNLTDGVGSTFGPDFGRPVDEKFFTQLHRLQDLLGVVTEDCVSNDLRKALNKKTGLFFDVEFSNLASILSALFERRGIDLSEAGWMRSDGDEEAFECLGFLFGKLPGGFRETVCVVPYDASEIK